MIFLRPLFLLLLFVPFAFLYIRKKKGVNSAWADVCDAKLLPYLIVNVGDEKRNKLYNILMFVLWCIGSIALAGPAILKSDIPTNSLQGGVIAVVDMSPVTDEKSIEQITHKLFDLTESTQDTSIGLILIDQKAYVALPLTQDKNIIRNIISQLKEKDIMPTVGQNIPAGIEYAEKLLKQSNFLQGQILVFTAGVDKAEEISDAVKKSKYDVFVIGVGNQEEKKPVLLDNGSFWNNGALYGLSDVKEKLGNSFLTATLDDSDLKHILKSQQLEQSKFNDTAVTQYQDFGIWLIAIMLPFIVLLFRKGFLFVFFMILLANNAYAGFWKRMEEEDYQTQINAIENFNAKKYEEALKGFSVLSGTDTEALYNQGNTLAYLGKIDEAIKTYENVLKQNPNHEDAAFNLAYLKKQQQAQQQQEQQQQSGGGQKSEHDKSKEQSSGDSGNENNEQNESQLNEEQKDKKSGQDKENKNESEIQNETDDKAEKENQPVITSQDDVNQNQQNQKEQPVSVANQKQKEWLDRINSDAGRVLRYRLRQQYGAQQ